MPVNKTLKRLFISGGIVLLLLLAFWTYQKIPFFSGYSIGQPIDSLNGVIVYYNGSIDHVSERNLTEDGYNLGLKYQCVEFVKRYYYQYFHHKMPDSYGHAKDFFDPALENGQLNKRRNLIQYVNPGNTKPKVNDLIVFDEHKFNKYGHVAIISGVTDDHIEIIQQNPGPNGKSRQSFSLKKEGEIWTIENDRILGWLRKI
ncbi:MAG: CHAP domain-containing protein [Bacteroidetes bacterium HGW-Bacteroidetes-21]|jgi:surface antigen|nr:MAG: CHAP domain-containing protein [Bacteroidetes bacterium HGW-Bacteroidetes-21]